MLVNSFQIRRHAFEVMMRTNHLSPIYSGFLISVLAREVVNQIQFQICETVRRQIAKGAPEIMAGFMINRSLSALIRRSQGQNDRTVRAIQIPKQRNHRRVALTLLKIIQPQLDEVANFRGSLHRFHNFTRSADANRDTDFDCICFHPKRGEAMLVRL